MEIAKERNLKVTDQLQNFLDDLDAKMDYQTKFAGKFTANKAVNQFNHVFGSMFGKNGTLPTEQEIENSDFDFWTLLKI